MRDYQALLAEYQRIQQILIQFRNESASPHRQPIQAVAIDALEEELLKLAHKISDTARIKGLQPY